MPAGRRHGASAGPLRKGGYLVEIAVKVVPNASRTEVVGFRDGVLKVRVSAPPEAGKANRAVEELLASALGLKRAAVTVARGHASPHKRVSIEGLAIADVERRLAAL